MRAAGDGQGEPAGELHAAALRRQIRRPQTIPPSARCSEQKDGLEQKIDTLKYQKAAMDPADYKKQLTEALLELAKVQQAA